MAAGLRKAGRRIHYTSAVIATACLMTRSAIAQGARAHSTRLVAACDGNLPDAARVLGNVITCISAGAIAVERTVVLTTIERGGRTLLAYGVI